MIKSIKKAGFKTIRLPVTWMYYFDNFSNVSSKWMSIIKEVVDWIINSNMYCILNVHHDGDAGNWLSKGINVKGK
jgi:endoglucanase